MKSRTVDAQTFSNQTHRVAAVTPRSALAKGAETADLRFIFAVCVAAFLVVALVARVLRVRWLASEKSGGTLLDEARSAAGMVVEFVSMN
jgi:hypothetical protein